MTRCGRKQHDGGAEQQQTTTEEMQNIPTVVNLFCSRLEVETQLVCRAQAGAGRGGVFLTSCCR